MTQPTPPASRHYPDLARLLFLVAAVLFVIAALFAGAVINGTWEPWALGALASVVLAWAVA